MDLHVVGPLASPAERAAVDAVLGPAESGWVGGTRDSRTDGHSASGGHATRARRSQLLPALHAVQSRIGWTFELGGFAILFSLLLIYWGQRAGLIPE